MSTNWCYHSNNWILLNFSISDMVVIQAASQCFYMHRTRCTQIKETWCQLQELWSQRVPHHTYVAVVVTVFSHCRSKANHLNNKLVWWSSGPVFAIISTYVFWKAQFQVFWECLRIQCVLPGYCDGNERRVDLPVQDYLADTHSVSWLKYIKCWKNLLKLIRLFSCIWKLIFWN